MRFIWPEDFVVFVLVLVIVFSLGGLVYGMNLAAKEHSRVMKQCMEDGLKEYECRFMIER